MNDGNCRIAMEKYGKQIPQDVSLELFRDLLKEVPDECMNELMFMSIKKRGVTLALSCFLGGLGVDRFYLGDRGLGAAKLVARIVALILNFVVPLAGTILGVASSLWWLVDIFLTYRKARVLNYNKLHDMLYAHKKDLFAAYRTAEKENSDKIA